MDYETRNKFEHLCALAEIEENPTKFADIRRAVTHLLDEKQQRLNRSRSFNYPQSVESSTIPRY